MHKTLYGKIGKQLADGMYVTLITVWKGDCGDMDSLKKRIQIQSDRYIYESLLVLERGDYYTAYEPVQMEAQEWVCDLEKEPGELVVATVLFCEDPSYNGKKYYIRSDGSMKGHTGDQFIDEKIRIAGKDLSGSGQYRCISLDIDGKRGFCRVLFENVVT